MTKVSIIVPVYKVEKHLEKCIDSILNQTLKDIEVILIDEGDIDKCREIIDDYEFGSKKDERIKTIHRKNGGYGASCNRGLEIAQGDYIGIVESDDFVEPDMYENLYNLITKNNCEVAKSNWYFYWGKKNKKEKYNRFADCKLNEVTNAKDCKELLCIQPSVWSALYKKSFLIENNIKFLETPGGSYQDTSFTFKVMLSAKKIILTDKAYLYYRQDNCDSSVNSKGKVYCLNDEYQEIFNYLNKKPELKEHFLQLIYSFEYHAHIGTWQRIDKKYKNDYKKYFTARMKQLFKDNELKDEFWQIVKKKEFMLLLTCPDLFYTLVFLDKIKTKMRNFRRKIISINHKSNNLNITILGRSWGIR